jgi:hypothetical protein
VRTWWGEHGDEQAGPPSVCFDGERFVVTYFMATRGYPRTFYYYCAVDAATGRPLDQPAQCLLVNGYDVPRPAMAARVDGGCYMGFFQRNHGWTYGRGGVGFGLLDMAPTWKPSPSRTVAEDVVGVYTTAAAGYDIASDSRGGGFQMIVDLARCGDRYLLVWDRYDEGGGKRAFSTFNMRVVGLVLDKTGRRFLDTAAERTAEPDAVLPFCKTLKIVPPAVEPLTISAAGERGYAMMPAAAGGNDRFLVVWSEERGPEDVPVKARIVEAK